MVKFHTIVLPVRPQPDTLIAILLLRLFGEEKYPGMREAKIESWSVLPEGKTPEALLREGYFLLDVGGGPLDHHISHQKVTASQLVADDLGVSANPAIAKLLQFAERDDKFGKGTISTDPLDRAFGFSGLLAALNKSISGDSQKVAELALPLLLAHYKEEKKRTEEIPAEYALLQQEGGVDVFETRGYGKKLKTVIITSPNPSLAGWLRSQEGIRADVVAQYLPSGHLNILTRPAKRIDLRELAALIRIRETMHARRDFEAPYAVLVKPGRLPEVPEWYYDRATNSIQNGGINPGKTPATHIKREELREVLELGLSGKAFSGDGDELEHLEAASPAPAGEVWAAIQSPVHVAFDPERLTVLLELAGDIVNTHDLEVAAMQNGLERKEELHITVVGFAQAGLIKKVLEKVSADEREEIVRCMEELVSKTDWRFRLDARRFHVAKVYALRGADGQPTGREELRESYIQMVQLPALEEFYRELNRLCGTRLEPPPPHVTLYAKSSISENALKGIGVNTWKDFERLNPQPI